MNARLKRVGEAPAVDDGGRRAALLDPPPGCGVLRMCSSIRAGGARWRQLTYPRPCREHEFHRQGSQQTVSSAFSLAGLFGWVLRCVVHRGRLRPA